MRDERAVRGESDEGDERAVRDEWEGHVDYTH